MSRLSDQIIEEENTWYLAVGKIFDEGHEYFAEFASEVTQRKPHPNPNIPTHEVEEELEEFWNEKWSMLR